MADDTPVPELLRHPIERAAREVALRLLEQAEKERRRLDDARTVAIEAARTAELKSSHPPAHSRAVTLVVGPEHFRQPSFLDRDHGPIHVREDERQEDERPDLPHSPKEAQAPGREGRAGREEDAASDTAHPRQARRSEADREETLQADAHQIRQDEDPRHGDAEQEPEGIHVFDAPTQSEVSRDTTTAVAENHALS